jgi:ABC-type sugar transport system, periplasmic component
MDARAHQERDQDQGPLLRRAGQHPQRRVVLVLKAVLAKAGVTEPKTEAEFWSALDKIKASGQIGFAQSGTLTYERATFTAVLLHMGGRDLYNKFYGDKDINAVKSPAFRTVLEKYKRLKTYTDPGVAGRSWNDTTALLVTDRAGFQTVGDWAKGEFLAAGKTQARNSAASPAGVPRRLHDQRRRVRASQDQ